MIIYLRLYTEGQKCKHKQYIPLKLIKNLHQERLFQVTLLTEGQTTFPFGVQQCEEFFLSNDSSVEKKNDCNILR